MAGRRFRSRVARFAATLLGFILIVTLTAIGDDAVSAQVEAPQRGEPFAIMRLAIGDVSEFDVSAAFVGIVDSYTARSDNEAAVSAAATGSAVTLTALAGGIAFVEVTATNDAGSVEQWIGVISEAAPEAETGDAAEDAQPDTEAETGDAAEDAQPDTEADSDSATATRSATVGGPSPLGIALVSRAYCWGWQITTMRLPHEENQPIERDEVGSFELSYSVVGGRAPYVVTSADGAEAMHSASGVLQMACGVPWSGTGAGSDRRYQPYGTGPVTFTAQVRDADGATASAEVTVRVADGTTFIDNGDGTQSEVLQVFDLAQPGHTYTLGTPAASTLIILVPGLDLRFASLNEDGIARFVDVDRGWEVQVDWATGDAVSLVRGVLPETNPLFLRVEPIEVWDPNRPPDAHACEEC